MADIDITQPDDTDLVSQFPANERNSREAILDIVSGLSTWGGTSSGSAQAQTVTIDITDWALAAGAEVTFVAGFANTATNPTLQVNSTTAKTVKSRAGAALLAGDIALSNLHTVRYDGTNWRLQDPALSGVLTQAVYDAMFPINKAIQFTATTDTPTVPSGITATWTRDSTGNYIRVASGTPTSGGSLSTSTEADHHHTVATQNGSQFAAGNQGPNAAVQTLTTSDNGSHSHTIEPTYTSLCKWLRTA